MYTGIQATTGLPALAMAARQPGRRQRLAARRRQSTRQRAACGRKPRAMATLACCWTSALEKGWKTYWRSPGRRRHRAGYRLASRPLEVNWRWPDAAALRRRGHFHSGLSRRRQLPDDAARRRYRRSLSGVLTLSTCSNVCILTDYPFSLDMTTSGGGAILITISPARWAHCRCAMA